MDTPPPYSHQNLNGPPANKPKGQKPKTPRNVAQDEHLLEKTPSPRPKSATRRLFEKDAAAGPADKAGGSNKIHTGPRGGKFIMVKGQKKYIK